MKAMKKGPDDKEDHRVMLWAALIAIVVALGALALNAYFRLG